MSAAQNPELKNQALEIVLELGESPASERAARMDQLCGGNDLLRAEVERLLAVQRAADQQGFLQSPALDDISPSMLEPNSEAHPDSNPPDASAAPDSKAEETRDPQAQAAQIETPDDVSGSSTLDESDATSGSPGSKVGSRADRFQRRHKLGEGGQGEVWLAFDPKLGRYVAVKEIKPRLRGSMDTVSGFRNEARLTGELEHPNIVTVYEAEHLHDPAAASAGGQAPFYVMRVFGNRFLMKAISEFYARPRTAGDHGLLTLLKAVQQQPTEENRQLLRVGLEEFPFDEQHACDARLREAIENYLNDPQALDGRSLHDAIRELHANPWSDDSERSLRELLRRFIHVCNAIAYAHNRGLIHRDLKPQNVMLGGFGETLVVDWGLAKVVGRDEQHTTNGEGTVSAARSASETIMGSIKGTPAYMPPEQACGDVTSLGPKSDIYSLGAILYALLAGRPPVTGNSATEILERVRDARLTKPTSHNPLAPKPLEAVCLKALSEKPLDRYATAQDLADDVARWLDDEPVTAWPEPLTIRARRWMKRNQTLVTSTAAAVLVAAVSLSVLLTVLAGKNEQLDSLNYNLIIKTDEIDKKNDQLTKTNTLLSRSLEAEKTARDLADENAAEAKRHHTRSDRQLANVYWLQGVAARNEHKYVDAAISFAESAKVHDRTETPSSANSALIASSCGPIRSFVHEDQLSGFAFSSDGSTLLTWTKKGVARIWSTTLDGSYHTFSYDTPVSGASYRNGGAEVITWHSDGSVVLWDALSARPLNNFAHKAPVLETTLTKDGSHLLARTKSSLYLWNVTTCTLIHEYPHTNIVSESRFPAGQQPTFRWGTDVSGATFSSDESRLLTWGKGGVAILWDVDRATPLHRFPHRDRVIGGLIRTDNARILTWNVEGSAKLWNSVDGVLIQEFRHPGIGGVKNASIDDKYDRLLTTGYDNQALLWENGTPQPVMSLQHEGVVVAAQLGESTRRAVTAGGDSVRVWEPHTQTSLEAFRYSSAVKGIAWHDDEDRLLSWHADGTVVLRSLKTAQQIIVVKLDESIQGAEFSPQRHRILTWNRNGLMHLWDVASREPDRIFEDDEVIADSTAVLSGNMERLLTCSIGSNRATTLWDVENGTAIRTFTHSSGTRPDTIYGRFTADDLSVLTQGSDGTARIWDADSEKPLAVFRHDDTVYGMTLSSDSSTVLTWSRDGTAKIWNAKQALCVHTLKHKKRVYGAVFNSDESQILTWSGDGTACLWSSVSGEALQVFAHGGLVEGAAFNDDESAVLSWGYTNAAKLWSVADAALIGQYHHEKPGIEAAFSADSSHVATWGYDGTAKLWDLSATDGPVRVVQHPSYAHASVNSDGSRLLTSYSGGRSVSLWSSSDNRESPLRNFIADGNILGWSVNRSWSKLLIWSLNGTAHLWDIDHEEPLLEFSHGGKVSGAAFSDDESRIVTWGTSPSGTVKLWTIPATDKRVVADAVLKTEIRCASAVSELGAVRRLSLSEWMQKCVSIQAGAGTK